MTRSILSFKFFKKPPSPPKKSLNAVQNVVFLLGSFCTKQAEVWATKKPMKYIFSDKLHGYIQLYSNPLFIHV